MRARIMMLIRSMDVPGEDRARAHRPRSVEFFPPHNSGRQIVVVRPVPSLGYKQAMRCFRAACHFKEIEAANCNIKFPKKTAT
jgi:hypothetical protein